MQSGNDIRRQGGDESGGRSYPNCNDRPETLSGRSRADPWRSKNAQTIEPRGASRFESKRQLRPSRRSGRENRSQDLTGFDLKSIDQGFRLVNRESALTGECFEF